MNAPSKSTSSDRLLGFEAEYADSLAFIPLAVRRKLDLAGAKISLSQWSALSFDARRALLLDPVSETTSASLWKSLLDASLREAGAEGSKAIAVDESPSWNDLRRVPHDVTAQASSVGIQIPLEAWASLDELFRFALAKLSRPGHENRNFLAAVREAGIGP